MGMKREAVQGETNFGMYTLVNFFVMKYLIKN